MGSRGRQTPNFRHNAEMMAQNRFILSSEFAAPSQFFYENFYCLQHLKISNQCSGLWNDLCFYNPSSFILMHIPPGLSADEWCQEGRCGWERASRVRVWFLR